MAGAELDEDGVPVAIGEIDEERDIHEVSVYVEGDGIDILRRIERAFGAAGETARPLIEALPDLDWVVHSLTGLMPVRAGRVLVHGAHDRDKRRIGDIAIEIEAAQAFGTGHHGTTSGCLDMVADVLRREKPGHALDLGAGSAVLAIAIARLACIPVLATDIDPVAVDVAAGNVRLNGVAHLVATLTAAGFRHPVIRRAAPFELIVANILARPLISLAPAMRLHLAGGGSLILSGILARQRLGVIAAYSGQGFRPVRTLHREGWVTLHLKRHGRR